MLTKNICLMLAGSVLLLGCSEAPQVLVRLEQGDRAFTVCQNGFRLEVQQSESLLDYAYILETPFVEFLGMDGVVDPEQSGRLKAIEWDRKLSLDDFPRFAFFDATPSTIGILTGSAGASGDRTQVMTFFDTKSDRHVQVTLQDMHPPQWILEDGLPIGFKEMRFDYVGSLALSLGYAPRLDKCWIFQGSEMRRDEAMEQRLFEELYEKFEYNADDLSERCKLLDEIDGDAAERFLNRIHCLVRLGKIWEADYTLGDVSEGLQKDVATLFGLIYRKAGYESYCRELRDVKAKNRYVCSVRFKEFHDQDTTIVLEHGEMFDSAFTDISWVEMNCWPRGKELKIIFNPERGTALLDPVTGRFIPLYAFYEAFEGRDWGDDNFTIVPGKHPIDRICSVDLGMLSTMPILAEQGKEIEMWQAEIERIYRQLERVMPVPSEVMKAREAWEKFLDLQLDLAWIAGYHGGSAVGIAQSVRMLGLVRNQALRLNASLGNRVRNIRREDFEPSENPVLTKE